MRSEEGRAFSTDMRMRRVTYSKWFLMSVVDLVIELANLTTGYDQANDALTFGESASCKCCASFFPWFVLRLEESDLLVQSTGFDRLTDPMNAANALHILEIYQSLVWQRKIVYLRSAWRVPTFSATTCQLRCFQ